MTLILLYALTLALFLGLDVLGLTYVVKPIFERDIGDMLLDSPRYGPALIFYAFYVAALLVFVSWPAIQGDWPLGRVFWMAGLIGAMAYGTYEFTNLATLKGWSWRMVLTDLTWGSLLTATSATLGVWLTRVTL
ncbi:DUF2177 family protein [Sulfitobacter sp. D35]|uniref:DUF2177 family protein n=1 Tax=Sulfitobacter sp. D35 TaxID=3083252 RepID=UPI00296F3083|nr:DUF2177 family protein [Sulfitobacter sp. D35]MDW4497795.1 DUF2177 family protein [Sulfitobacter sp. D35]